MLRKKRWRSEKWEGGDERGKKEETIKQEITIKTTTITITRKKKKQERKERKKIKSKREPYQPRS